MRTPLQTAGKPVRREGGYRTEHQYQLLPTTNWLNRIMGQYISQLSGTPNLAWINKPKLNEAGSNNNSTAQTRSPVDQSACRDVPRDTSERPMKCSDLVEVANGIAGMRPRGLGCPVRLQRCSHPQGRLGGRRRKECCLTRYGYGWQIELPCK